ncbi:uncharacterized protein BKCO1_5700044 [Diplodia corticola]|uniref:Integral membrane protein n=1 Tax=Diplodia corticola TaxID=236234 RepID=A0A1J9QP16_9PEZI|nr:uncharacterized protein BKCO1_5700044 [Diplodia corticola]OJD30654.1 hypothetical protein BKCO1_5700044 [Diplodia corticola]
MIGTLVPSWWKFYEVTPAELAVVSIEWGFTLGWTIFATGTAMKQTLHIWRRKKRITMYIVMIWAELVASSIIGFFGWFYMMGMIPPRQGQDRSTLTEECASLTQSPWAVSRGRVQCSFEFFFFVLFFWVIQIQVILQIIVNRVGLLLPDKHQVRNIKWCVAGYVGIINVSVFCIWLPAQLQRSTTYVHLNHIWDPVTKALFLLLDAALNCYFLYIIRRDLIANGLRKYITLFRANAGLAMVSVFMDIAIILSMLSKNPFVYVQFHPLAYLVKLSIEMSLADLIAKLVRAAAAASSITTSSPLSNTLTVDNCATTTTTTTTTVAAADDWRPPERELKQSCDRGRQLINGGAAAAEADDGGGSSSFKTIGRVDFVIGREDHVAGDAGEGDEVAADGGWRGQEGQSTDV